MPGKDDNMEHLPLIQLFDNGHDQAAKDSAQRIEEAGYTVYFFPTSGPSVLSINDSDVTGGTAISSITKSFLEHRGRR